MSQKKNSMPEVRAKLADYKRFAVISLCVSVFFYIGMILPADTKTGYATYGYLTASLVFLIASVLFFSMTIRLKKLIAEEDDESIHS